MKARQIAVSILAMMGFMLSLSAHATDKATLMNFYNGIDGLKGEALKTALYKIIEAKHTRQLTYKDLWEVYKTADVREDGKIWDIYSNTTNYTPGTDQDKGNHKNEGDKYNREHTVPQSWFSENMPMKGDAFHVYPTDATINGIRANFYFGEVGTVSKQSNNGFSKLGTCKTEGYSGTVFEPNDLYKGDIARTYFYMATRYENLINGWGEVFGNGTYPGIKKWQLDMLMRWAKNDPVSKKEIDRNDAIETFQHNRNPFIDFPMLAEYVWGDSVNTPFPLYTTACSYIGELPDDGLITPSVSFGTSSVTIILGDAFNAPTLISSSTGTVTYTSSNPSVATVDDEGNVTVLAAGTTTITASVAADGNYRAASANYTIKVTEKQSEETNPGEITGDEVTFDFTPINYFEKQNNPITEVTQGIITAKFDKGSGTASPLWSNNGNKLGSARVYNGNTLTLTSSSNAITKIEFTYNTGNKTFVPDNTTWTTNEGTFNTTATTWTGEATSVEFTNSREQTGQVWIATIKVTYADGSEVIIPEQEAIYETTYTLVTSANDLKVGAKYIITSNEDGVAMGAQSGKIRSTAAAEFSADKQKIVSLSSDAREIVLGGTPGEYTLYDVIDKAYIATVANGNNITKTTDAESAKATITIDGNHNATIKYATGKSQYLKYNAGNPRFTFYKANSTGMKLVQLYRKMEKNAGKLTLGAVDENSGDVYGTVYCDHAFVMPEGVTGTTIVDASNGKLTMNWEYTAGTTVPAETALLLKGNEKKEVTYMFTTSDEQAPADNWLHGTLTDELTEGDGRFYKLTYKNKKNLGFYWGAADGAAFTNKAGKAYLMIPASEASAKISGFTFGDNATAIEGVTTASRQEADAIYTLQGTRVMGQPTKGIYIKNGKKIVVR